MSALALFWLQILFIVLSAIGGPPSPGTSYTLPLYLLVPLFLAALALAASIGQFLGARWAWYVSIAFWIILLSHFVWYAYMIDFAHGIIWLDRWGYFLWYGFEGFLATLTPLLYSIGCLAYFLTRKPREYFHV
jgi:hypothetical protein